MQRSSVLPLVASGVLKVVFEIGQFAPGELVVSCLKRPPIELAAKAHPCEISTQYRKDRDKHESPRSVLVIKPFAISNLSSVAQW